MNGSTNYVDRSNGNVYDENGNYVFNLGDWATPHTN